MVFILFARSRFRSLLYFDCVCWCDYCRCRCHHAVAIAFFSFLTDTVHFLFHPSFCLYVSGMSSTRGFCRYFFSPSFSRWQSTVYAYSPDPHIEFIQTFILCLCLCVTAFCLLLNRRHLSYACMDTMYVFWVFIYVRSLISSSSSSNNDQKTLICL